MYCILYQSLELKKILSVIVNCFASVVDCVRVTFTMIVLYKASSALIVFLLCPLLTDYHDCYLLRHCLYQILMWVSLIKWNKISMLNVADFDDESMKNVVILLVHVVYLMVRVIGFLVTQIA